MTVEFRLLGLVEVVSKGVAVPLGGSKPQTLLATLLLQRGQVVPTTRLVDVIWPHHPPETARAVIQTYVKSLRQALARHGLLEVIVTRAPGYMAQVSPGELDLEIFERLVGEGRHAATPQVAADRLEAALALWRGPALAGLEDSLLAGEAARLEQLRLTVTEERIAADLELGRQERVVTELAALVAGNPANERLRGQYMVALYRLGRQSDALATYREGRKALIDELGVDPGPELSGIHTSILRADTGLLGKPAEPVARDVMPAQLPVVPADFTGRAAQIAALAEALMPRPGSWAGPVQVVAGQGGSGKSTLAARVCRQLAASFPDGQLYAELRGTSEAPADPAEVLGRLLKALGMDTARLPVSLEERTERYRSILEGRRVLVLLDDAASASQLQPLLPGSPACAVLITARDRLGDLAGAGHLDLDVLDLEEAVELLERIVGAGRVRAEQGAARQIVEYCGRLPLAIRIVGARLATRQRWPLRLLADRLAGEHRRLDELVLADLAVRASLHLSYQGLEPGARSALRRLGYLGVPAFGRWIVAWLLDCGEEKAEELIECLVDAHLADISSVDDLGVVRYRIHDLVRIFARERAEEEDPAAVQTEAVARVLRNWLGIIDQAVADSPPDEIQWQRPAVDVLGTGTVPATPDWFEAEQPALVVGVERAASLGLHDLVCHFASARLGPSFLGVNRFEARERINAAALAAARRAGDLRGEAILLAELGHLRYLQDRFVEAQRHYTQALDVFRQLGEPHGQAVALVGLGTTCREPGRLPEASYFLEQASALVQEIGDKAGIAYVQRLAGSVRLERGDFPGAWTRLAESLDAYRQLGSRRGEGTTLRTMSLYHRAVGELDEALTTAGAALTIFRQLGDRLMTAYAVRTKAKAELRLGRVTETLEPLEWCLSVCQAMGDRWGQAISLRTLGELHLAAGRLDDAEDCLTSAIELWEEMDAPLWRARAERDLALLLEARGLGAAAADVHARALKTFFDHGAREYTELTAVGKAL
ncbi:AfsR/SARP family transcriptional regulator [Sphaerisporangium aureirubrum]|uniref:BTAD domain-containing putative transcriptional regulator n=1 Tax=Sphaerisporangium aureirubrum TaxID=1544736 RepID=A0ABW1NF79_9ACTN